MVPCSGKWDSKSASGEVVEPHTSCIAGGEQQ